MDLNAAAALVTGGASGIGLASARRLAALGARVLILDMNEAKGEAVAKELGGAFVKADVANEEQVQRAVDKACEMGPLRAVLNGCSPKKEHHKCQPLMGRGQPRHQRAAHKPGWTGRVPFASGSAVPGSPP